MLHNFLESGSSLLIESAPASIATIDLAQLGSGQAWLEFLGRLHPVVVHFPIALIVVAAAIECCAACLRKFRRSTAQKHVTGSANPTARLCVWIGFATALLAGGCGWLLASNEPVGSTQADTVELHRWIAVSGTGLAFIAVMASLMKSRRGYVVYLLSLVLSALGVGLAGHFGGSMVHGEGYLLAPFNEEVAPEPAPSAHAALEISAAVAAVFDEHCIACHGERRQNANLRLDRSASLQSRGVVIAGNPDESVLLDRVLLPADHLDAMPPSGRERLTDELIDVIRNWIQDNDAELDSETSMEHETDTRMSQTITLSPEQRVAHANAVDAIRSLGGVVVGIAEDSDGVAVSLNLLGEQVTDRTLAVLAGLEHSLVTLDLSGTAISDDAGTALAGMQQLQELSLARTAAGDATVAAIRDLPKLESLNLFATTVTDHGASLLVGAPALRVVYLYKSNVTPEGMAALHETSGTIQFVYDGNGP